MKSRYGAIIAAAGFALALVTACAVVPMPVNSALPPPIPRTRAPVVPQNYAWDGFEFVGRVGSNYYYLGPNNTWMVLDGIRLRRFQQWQRANPNWQQRQIRNTRYFQIQPLPGTTVVGSALPPPIPRTRAPVPPAYVWDGFEFVGRTGGKYYYLGPRNNWLPLDGSRQNRFQQWQRANPNWQQRQIRNTRYLGHDRGQSQIQPIPNTRTEGSQSPPANDNSGQNSPPQ